MRSTQWWRLSAVCMAQQGQQVHWHHLSLAPRAWADLAARRTHPSRPHPPAAVGCGDSFAAALVLGYTREHSIPAVMALANAVGAATAMGQGAGRNVARAEQVHALLASAVPGCADGRHLDALDVLHSSLSSLDSE